FPSLRVWLGYSATTRPGVRSQPASLSSWRWGTASEPAISSRSCAASRRAARTIASRPSGHAARRPPRFTHTLPSTCAAAWSRAWAKASTSEMSSTPETFNPGGSVVEVRTRVSLPMVPTMGACAPSCRSAVQPGTGPISHAEKVKPHTRAGAAETVTAACNFPGAPRPRAAPGTRTALMSRPAGISARSRIGIPPLTYETGFVTLTAAQPRAGRGRTIRIGERRVSLVRTVIGGATALATAAVTALAIVPSAHALSTNGEFNYAEALQDSMLFYAIQRSGQLPPDNPVDWRGDSDLSDGSDHGVNLTGGYHDAGDLVKFGLPEAYSMTMLAWSLLDYPAGYSGAGQTQTALENLRWGDDYILSAFTGPTTFYGQVGDASTDRSYWGPAETNPNTRPSYAITASCAGADLAG